MATKVRIPQVRFISKVTLMIGRVLVTTKSGKERSFRYEALTPKQESKLRAMAQPLPKRQEVKASKSRSASLPRKTFNYAAAQVCSDSVFVTANGRTSVLEVL
jgi:hypothetical protein